jgi:hypothetical protein
MMVGDSNQLKVGPKIATEILAISEVVNKFAARFKTEAVLSMADSVRKKSIQAYDLGDLLYMQDVISGYRAIQGIVDWLMAVRIASQFHVYNFADTLNISDQPIKKKAMKIYGLAELLGLAEPLRKLAKKKAFADTMTITGPTLL